MEKILLTGGAGYKGVKVAKKMLDEGYHVTILDNFMYGFDAILHLMDYKKIDVIKHDIRNPIDKISQYDIIFHLAGISGYPACESNPNSAQLINVEATKQLVTSLSKSQLLIYASTTSFYGKSGNICDENIIIKPINMYGITKYKAEQLIMERENSVSLRFATVFGPSPKMRMDLMVNDFTYKAIKEKCLVLFDSYAKRTFIHIDDASNSYLFTLKNIDAMRGNIFNIGGDHLNYSKLEIAQLINNKVDFKIIDSDIKDKDVRHFIISYKKIKNIGFIPQKTIENGIDELIKIFKFYDYFSFFKVI